MLVFQIESEKFYFDFFSIRKSLDGKEAFILLNFGYILKTTKE